MRKLKQEKEKKTVPLLAIFDITFSKPIFFIVAKPFAKLSKLELIFFIESYPLSKELKSIFIPPNDLTTKAIKDQTSSTIESAKEQEAQASAIRGLVENLRGLTDSDGFFDSGNIEAVKYYVDEINSQMQL